MLNVGLVGLGRMGGGMVRPAADRGLRAESVRRQSAGARSGKPMQSDRAAHRKRERRATILVGLLATVLLHIWSAIQLTVENRAARPQPYAQQELVAASYASRTMIWSGFIIAAFVIYHLLHFTVGVKAINLTGTDFTTLKDAQGRHDVYAMMVLGFRNPVVSVFYIIAMTLLCLHLSHGVSAMFQSLGWKSPAYAPIIDRGAQAISWIIYLGYISIPISVLAGGLGKSYLQSKGLLP